MRKKSLLILISFSFIIWYNIGFADFTDIQEEVIAVKSWIDTPFSAEELETERDAKIAELQHLVKGEFETTEAFEQRKRGANIKIEAIRKEYEKKIQDSQLAYNEMMSKLREKFNNLLKESRETIIISGTLGTYEPDQQQFPLRIKDKTIKMSVPLSIAPEVKNNFKNYKIYVTRQLNENCEWDYLEARIEGKGNVFYSTDKAPTISPYSVGIALIPPDLSSTVSFIEPSGNNLLDAEETAQLNITISNKGKGNAGMVEAKLDLGSIAGISYPKSIYF